jgi:hypothetical protein
VALCFAPVVAGLVLGLGSAVLGLASCGPLAPLWATPGLGLVAGLPVEFAVAGLGLAEGLEFAVAGLG